MVGPAPVIGNEKARDEMNRSLQKLSILFMVTCLYGGEPADDPFAHLDPSRVAIVDLHNILSPTSIAWKEDRFYLTADLMEFKPGIFMLTQNEAGNFLAHPVKLLPQQALEGLTLMRNGWLVTSQRFFSAYEEDWTNQLLVLEKSQFRMLNRQIVNVDNVCADGTVNCGIVGAVPLENDQLLVVTRQRLAQLHVLAWKDGAWESLFHYPVGLENKYQDVSEVRRIGDQLYLLFPGEWAIGRLPMEKVLEVQVRKQDFASVFSFKSLRNKFSVKNARLHYDGMAEGFDFDDKGNLWVVINNRGFAYRRISSTSFTGKLPKLLIFPKAVDEEPSSEATEP